MTLVRHIRPPYISYVQKCEFLIRIKAIDERQSQKSGLIFIRSHIWQRKTWTAILSSYIIYERCQITLYYPNYSGQIRIIASEKKRWITKRKGRISWKMLQRIGFISISLYRSAFPSFALSNTSRTFFFFFIHLCDRTTYPWKCIGVVFDEGTKRREEKRYKKREANTFRIFPSVLNHLQFLVDVSTS